MSHQLSIIFNKGPTNRRVSETEYLSVKEFDSKLITAVSTQFDTTGVKITVTPATGKTYYLHKAKVIFSNGGDSATDEYGILCVVKFDGVIVDYFGCYAFQTIGAEGMGWGGMNGVETIVKGKKMVGNGTKKVEVEVIEIHGTNPVSARETQGYVILEGFEEDDATSPQLT